MAISQLTKIMLITGLLLFSLQGYSSNLAYAQNQSFTFHLQNVSIAKVLQTIEEQSEFIFMYRADLFDADKKVSVKADKMDVAQILEQILAGTGVTYEINDRQITLKGKNPQPAQQVGTKKLVQGIVKDQTGEPVIGATVQVKGTSIGTITTLDGLYHLQVPSSKSVLVISFVGYVTQEVEVGDRETIPITLIEDAKTLEEVVVTAFGSGQKKASMVGSVQSVRATDLKVPSSNLSNSFAGRLAGVITMQDSGRPGIDGSNFYIRGISTMNGVTDPLIVLDGVEITSDDLNSLDPEIIESFSVLKDATATAMYGTRGANGVLIITTKSGRNIDKPIINFRVEGKITTPTSRPKVVDGVTYMELFNESLENSGSIETGYSAEEIEGTRLGLNPYVYPDVNWYDEIFKNHTFNQNVNFNIRGGGRRVDYFSSVTFSHETGMLKDRSREFFSYNNNIDVKRYSFQNNINAYLGKSSRLSLHLNVQFQNGRQPKTNMQTIFEHTLKTSPVEAPVYFPSDGAEHVKWGVTDRTFPGDAFNPVAELVSGYQDEFKSTVLASLEFEQKLDMLTKGLKFKALASFRNYTQTANIASAGWNKYNLRSYSVDENGNYILDTILRNGEGGEVSTALSPSVSNSGSRRFYYQAMLDYSRTFGKHDVNAMVIYNQDELVNQLFSGDLIAALPKRKQGIAARLSYAYDGKYLAEVNMGYNGSENFAKGHRWGFFPSLALGYNISEEDFFEPLRNVITRMKIRGSIGLVGNDNINSSGTRFGYLAKINLSGNSYTTGYNANLTYSGPSYTRFANPELTWEVGQKIDVGLDLSLFNSLNLTVDYFREDRDNIFQERGTVPQYMGTQGTQIYGNLARMKNEGVDLSIDLNKRINKDLNIMFKSTFTYAYNTILEYDEMPAYSFQSRIGKSANLPGILISDGLFSTQEEVDNSNQQIGGVLAPGDIKYVNISKLYGYDDDIVNSNDWIWAKYPTVPEIMYGFGPSIYWKNFDFSVFFQGAAHVSLVMSGFHPFGDNSMTNVLTWIAEDHWSKDNPNPNAAYPRLTKDTSANNTASSDYWLRNASYLKLKNAEIGYTWKNMRFFVSGMNLLTFAPFKHWDPEQGGGSGLKYPIQRAFNFGFQMSINNK